MNDALRTALRSTIESIIALVVILGLFNLTTEQVGAIMLVVTNFLTLSMFFWKTGQSIPLTGARIGIVVLLVLTSGYLLQTQPSLL
jgi:uncharacterized membrane protein YphA (DoxX/SURF4 family)